jgi:hypothetical protein
MGAYHRNIQTILVYFGEKHLVVIIKRLISYGFIEEAYTQVCPMIDRVIENNGFYEWYAMGGVPSGSGNFKGSAGVLSKAIEMFRGWAKDNK